MTEEQDRGSNLDTMGSKRTSEEITANGSSNEPVKKKVRRENRNESGFLITDGKISPYGDLVTGVFFFKTEFHVEKLFEPEFKPVPKIVRPHLDYKTFTELPAYVKKEPVGGGGTNVSREYLSILAKEFPREKWRYTNKPGNALGLEEPASDEETASSLS